MSSPMLATKTCVPLTAARTPRHSRRRAATTIFNFNDNEQLTGELQPYNIEQDATYDQANRLSSLSAVNNANHALLNTSYRYGYDPLGLTDAITTTVQGVPSAQALTHDAAGRLTGASGSSTGAWVYDGRGNLASATFDGATTTYGANPANPEEVASATTGGTAVSYSYDGDATVATTGTTIFTTQAPAGTYSGTRELGVKFQSTQAGYIAGLRYYRNPGETGVHTGHLWSASGTLLGSVSFADEGARGWQTAFFASPVAISAGTTYVASYNANAAFSATLGGIATGVANGPLSTIVGNNGVYSTSPGSFPAMGTSGNNYFADVVFEAQARLVQITLGVPVTETIALGYNAFGQRASDTVTPAGKSAQF